MGKYTTKQLGGGIFSNGNADHGGPDGGGGPRGGQADEQSG